jgi:hypothetical protein
VAQGVSVRRPMGAQQQAIGGVRESSFEVLHYLLVEMVVPDHGLEVSGVNGIPW